MPDYKIVDAEKLNADLKYVADKIRAKAETSEKMDFPLGYGDVVDSILKGENLEDEISAQEALIVEIKEALEGKTIGSEPTPMQEKTVEIKANGTVEILPDEGWALSKVTANVDVPIPEGYIKPSGTKEITENGTHDVSEFTSVEVAVAGSSSGENIAAKIADGTITEIKAEDLQGATNIRQYLFYKNTNLTSVVLPHGITQIDIYAFYCCYYLINVTIPNSVVSISSNAFYGCERMTDITIPDSVTSIGDSAFYGCSKIVNITIPDSVRSLGQQAFRDCKYLQNANISNNITSINQMTFYNCVSLTQITIGNGVTEFGNAAFSGCSKLTSLVFPSGLAKISTNVFNNCRSMKFYDFTKCTSVPTLANANAFQNIPADCEIRVSMALVDEWKAATNWSTYANQIVGV